MQNNQVALAEIAEKIKKCTACDLYKNATNAVPGEGSPNSKVFFIGEGPGFYEDQSGRPFVGRAGQLLESTLKKVGLSREEVFIGNVVKHRPPENRDPVPSEISACAPWLEQQLLIIQPKVVVTLGRFSLARFLPSAKISAVHGQPRQVGRYVVIPMYHPAAALRGLELMKTFQEDFVKNKELLLNPELGFKSDSNENDEDQIKLF